MTEENWLNAMVALKAMITVMKPMKFQELLSMPERLTGNFLDVKNPEEVIKKFVELQKELNQ